MFVFQAWSVIWPKSIKSTAKKSIQWHSIILGSKKSKLKLLNPKTLMIRKDFRPKKKCKSDDKIFSGTAILYNLFRYVFFTIALLSSISFFSISWPIFFRLDERGNCFYMDHDYFQAENQAFLEKISAFFWKLKKKTFILCFQCIRAF